MQAALGQHGRDKLTGKNASPVAGQRTTSQHQYNNLAVFFAAIYLGSHLTVSGLMLSVDGEMAECRMPERQENKAARCDPKFVAFLGG